MMNAARIFILLVTYFFPAGFSQEVPSSQLKLEHRGNNCDCMEYWSCITSGGSPYSYCGLSESSVCCITSSSEGFIPPSASEKPKCGVKGYDSGKDGFAEPSEWPWHVAIVEEPGFYYVCGGTLIDEFWVLTAAHCVDEYVENSNFKLKVRLGEYDVTSTVETLRHEDRPVDKIVIHPQYNNDSLINDIALLKLQYPAKQSPHIDVVCVPKEGSELPYQSRCVITGWGRKSEDSNYSNILKEIIIPLWNASDCQESLKREFGPAYPLSNSTFCAGAPGQDACDGDGGGPLVCQKDGQWYQHGIVSYGIGCGQNNAPGVYTSVSHYEKWIKETVLFSKIKL